LTDPEQMTRRPQRLPLNPEARWQLDQLVSVGNELLQRAHHVALSIQQRVDHALADEGVGRSDARPDRQGPPAGRQTGTSEKQAPAGP
jgi:hypothetical protein